jgi:NADH-quinone oxidoreductase subunit L
MVELLWLVPIIPFAGFAVLALFGSMIPRKGIAAVGVGSVGLSAALAFAVAAGFLATPPAGGSFSQVLWTWIRVSNFEPQIAFYLDPLALIMMLVVTFVGFLIHLYSSDYMADDEGYRRFFAYMNLFVGSMLTLVLADNLLLLYLGWEGVGLCSYLLIGFWYTDPANGRAARKAFIVTRVGDAAMAVGLFLIFANLGTLQIQELMHRAAQQWATGSGIAIAGSALLLGGALGKSAQLPLQTWLPDAMAGPTPVSALIHAATMVTAGVYLIARTNVLFTLAPSVLLAVAIIGALTLLLAGFSALTQWDIKRVLAYSTISQIGYMFLGLGVGGWAAAIFHFMTHAFFKALLFLAAGVVITRLDEEHNIFKMGGLWKELPVTFVTFVIGASSLSALPLITAGFYSKDLILFQAWSAADGSPWLWAAGIVGALLTAMYAFRVVFIAFLGDPGEAVQANRPLKKPGAALLIPLLVLGILSIIGGLIDIPKVLGNVPVLSDFLHRALPTTELIRAGGSTEGVLLGVSAGVCLIGIAVAYFFFRFRPQVTARMVRTPVGTGLHRFWFADWGFDWLYNTVLVRPYVWLAETNRGDVIDQFFVGIARLAAQLNNALSWTQSGRVRWYAGGVAFGAIVGILLVVFL